MIDKTRRGLIRISHDLLNTIRVDYLLALFNRFIPIHIDSNNFLDEYVYYGYSPFFDKIEDSIKTPEYQVIFSEKDEGYFDIVFKRRDI